MNTSNKINEAISTLADGEASDAEIDAALAALETEEGRAQWAMLHQIGDALRSDETAAPMRAEFLPALFARLDAEPVVLAPAAQPAADGPSATADSVTRPGLARRFAVPGIAAAAAAAFALFGGSQLMVAQRAPAAPEAAVMLASASQPPAARAGAAGSAASEQAELLRDPDIDQYLMAHQRFSPSFYSTAQYARSPVFAAESGK